MSPFWLKRALSICFNSSWRTRSTVDHLPLYSLHVHTLTSVVLLHIGKNHGVLAMLTVKCPPNEASTCKSRWTGFCVMQNRLNVSLRWYISACWTSSCLATIGDGLEVEAELGQCRVYMQRCFSNVLRFCAILFIYSFFIRIISCGDTMQISEAFFFIFYVSCWCQIWWLIKYGFRPWYVSRKRLE